MAPNTLHFRDPKAFDDIFKFTSNFTKDPDFYDHLGQSEALFGMPDEEAHKERFKTVADLFSKRFAQLFETNIAANVDPPATYTHMVINANYDRQIVCVTCCS